MLPAAQALLGAVLAVAGRRLAEQRQRRKSRSDQRAALCRDAMVWALVLLHDTTG